MNFSDSKMELKFQAFVICLFFNIFLGIATDEDKIDIVDLTCATNWKGLSDYYTAVERRWKTCLNCGHPGLGTVMHLETSPVVGSMLPSVIPSEYLLTRLVIIDVSGHSVDNDSYVLTLEMALQWPIMRHDPKESTLLLFKFGWKADGYFNYRFRSCICRIPGISYELAEWISMNLTHVVGVATDAPTLESDQTREFTTRTVTNLLGKNGVYMIENVNIRKKIPEQGCMAMSMPLKLLHTNYVPTRLTAFCPTTKTAMNVVVALKNLGIKETTAGSRFYDINMDELLN